MTKEVLDKTIEAIKARGRLVASASQIESYDLCIRKWGWRYIAKIRAPPNQWAALGLDVHKVLESFLRNGVPPDRNTKAGAIALPGLKFLPQPGAAIIEGKFLWQMPDEPFDLVGVIDWRDFLESPIFSAVPVPRIGDHKTTGDFKWAKTSEELREDVQATIYAAYTAYLTGEEQIFGRWVYYRTKGRPQARPVDWKTDLTILAESFNKVLESGREMADWHQQQPRVEEMPYDAKGCGAYGGCPFRENCNLSSKERLVALMAQETLKEKMARKKAERAQAAPAAAAAPAPAVNPPEAAQQVAPPAAAAPEQMSLKEKVAARKVGHPPAAAGAPVPVAPAAVPPSGQPTLKDKMAARKAAQAGTAGVPPPAVPVASPASATTTAAAVAPVAPALPPVAGAPPALVPAVDMQGFGFLFVDCAPIKSDGLKTIPSSNLLTVADSSDIGAYLDANPLPEGVGVTMTMRTPEGAALFEALSARATHVVRGF